MTNPPTPPYTEATVELAVKAIVEANWTAKTPGSLTAEARAVLDALAEAGLLLPEGVETRTEWAWTHDNLAERCLHTVPCEEDARKTASYFDGIQLMRRQMQIGPWESVDAVRLAEGDNKPSQDHTEEPGHGD